MTPMELISTFLMGLGVLAISYFVITTDSSNEYIDKTSKQIQRKGIHKARTQRSWYVVVLIIYVILFAGGLKFIYISKLKQDVESLKERVFYLKDKRK